MRVIAGQYRSRLLEAPRGTRTRPTSDKLRETLFNVLGPRVAGSCFVDLYAGSGAVGIEALSRGAASVWFAEDARGAVTTIRRNLEALRIFESVVIEGHGVKRLLNALVERGDGVDLVFLDPPYDAEGEYVATLGFLARHAQTLLAADAVVIAEHARKQPPGERYGVLVRSRLLEQGDAALSFYHVSQDAEAGFPET